MIAPSPETTAAWTALMRAARRRFDAVETALKQAGLPPLAWYDALWEIERAGAGGLRPYELTERLLLPQYGTSRLLDRMARDGLIDRTRSTDDGRGQVIRLTTAGQTMRARMWPVYAAALCTGLQDRLTQAEAATLAGLLGKLA